MWHPIKTYHRALAHTLGVILSPSVNSFFEMRNGQPNKSRGWCFTINNPGLFDDVDIEELKKSTIYGVVGKETGETGTPHYQGFCRFEHPVSFKRIHNIVKRAHLETQKGSTIQAADYCKKDGDYEEWGEPPAERKSSKERWKWIINMAEFGELDAIKDEYPGEYLRHYDRLRSLRIRQPIIMDELQNEWWWGPTGTGKSRHAWECYPDHYQKPLNKWWDGYEGEETVVIEEWAPKNEMTASNLKIWSDRYPFSAEIKGGTLRRIRPRRIIVTSNYRMEDCFERPEDLQPLKRRFKVVHFPMTPWSTEDIINDF